MDRNKICEAMYALPGGVVVKRRKSQLRAAVLFIAGVALVVVNNMYGAELTNNMRSAIVFIGGLLGLARANVPALTVALYRTPDNSFAAMQAFEYADLEYKPLTRLNIVDKA